MAAEGTAAVARQARARRICEDEGNAGRRAAARGRPTCICVVAEAASAEADDQLADVRAEAQAVIDEARAEAETERQRLVGRAEREVSAMKEIAESEIARDREEALAALQPQVADLAVGAASKVMDRPVDAGAARPIVDRFLNNPI